MKQLWSIVTYLLSLGLMMAVVVSPARAKPAAICALVIFVAVLVLESAYATHWIEDSDTYLLLFLIILVGALVGGGVTGWLFGLRWMSWLPPLITAGELFFTSDLARKLRDEATAKRFARLMPK